jgi:predicted phage terminase large subunit-like protein
VNLSRAELDTFAASAARDSLLAYAIGMSPSYKTPPHIELLADKLEAVSNGEIKRLMVFMPPRHGKSNLCSELFPAWYMGHHPQDQVMFTTYGQDLADGFGRKVRNALADERHVRSFPGSVLAQDSRSAQRFNTTVGGVYYAVGAGGAVTGRGANCVVTGTMIETSDGSIPIDKLHLCAPTVKILSLNHLKRSLEYRSLQAISSRSADGFYRITTSSGRTLQVTGEHRVFAGGEYKRADAVSPGESFVCLVQQGVYPSCPPSVQGGFPGSPGSLLQCSLLHITSFDQALCWVRGVWGAGKAQWGKEGRKVLFGMPTQAPGPGYRAPSDSKGVPNVRRWLSGEVARFGEVCRVLWQAVRGDRSLQVDGFCGKPNVEGWRNAFASTASLCQGFPRDAASHTGARWPHVRAVRGAGVSACASHRQLADEQLGEQLGHAVCPASPEVARGNGWVAQAESVALVERVCEEVCVYDIQVEGNHNLFAAGVCVHNCLIIDDPLKSREEADSKLIRDKLWDWYASTAYTRLMPGGAVVLVQTRWHEDDLAGRLLNGHEKWDTITLPALAEPMDALGRNVGEALWPEQYDVQALQTIRQTIGEREFVALYQQRPSALEGAMFKREWLHRAKAPRAGMRIAMGVDLALSTKTSADYTAIVVIGRDEFGKLYILDAVRERVDFPGALRLIRDVADKWKPRAIAIEQVAFQAVVVQELLRQTTLPIKGVTPDKDKVTRAQPLALRYEQGLVFHEDLPSWFEDELLSFPQGAHDDGVDAAAYAYQSVMSMSARGGAESYVPPFEPLDAEMGF